MGRVGRMKAGFAEFHLHPGCQLSPKGHEQCQPDKDKKRSKGKMAAAQGGCLSVSVVEWRGCADQDSKKKTKQHRSKANGRGRHRHLPNFKLASTLMFNSRIKFDIVPSFPPWWFHNSLLPFHPVSARLKAVFEVLTKSVC